MSLPIMVVAGAVTAAMVKRRRTARRHLAARHHVTLVAWVRRWLDRLRRSPAGRGAGVTPVPGARPDRTV